MLAAAISDPQQVTLHWLRLACILALAMLGLSVFFLFRREGPVDRVAFAISAFAAAAIIGQLGFGQTARRRTQQVFAWVAFFYCFVLGARYLRPAGEVTPQSMIFIVGAAIGIAAMSGLALMDMLLGHAYLTASNMTTAPFRKLNAWLAGTLVWRAILTGVATAMMTREIWMREGLFIMTRWLVGLVVPAVFIYMAHDCIQRRSTQSATGILYVAGVLIFIGEIIALYLVRTTGLSF